MAGGMVADGRQPVGIAIGGHAGSHRTLLSDIHSISRRDGTGNCRRIDSHPLAMDNRHRGSCLGDFLSAGVPQTIFTALGGNLDTDCGGTHPFISSPRPTIGMDAGTGDSGAGAAPSSGVESGGMTGYSQTVSTTRKIVHCSTPTQACAIPLLPTR